jgi:cytochrome b561
MTTKTSDGYDAVAKTFHWVMAAAIIGLWMVGILLDGLPKGPMKSEVIGVHKAIGVIVLVLALGRIAWRVARPAPQLPVHMPKIEQVAAKLGHLALYLLMVAIPLDGILMSQSAGREVSVFGLVLPVMLDKNEVLRNVFKAGHEFAGWLLAAVVVGHVLAAFRHHVILKDDILRRMLPNRT